MGAVGAPTNETGGHLAQNVLLVVRGDERDGLPSPVDVRVVLVQPWHAEDDVVAAELRDGEAEGLAVGADAHRNGRDEAASTLLVTVSEGDGVRDTIRDDGQLTVAREGGRDEVTRSAAVDEDDGGTRRDGACKFDELARGGGDGGRYLERIVLQGNCRERGGDGDGT